MSRAHPAAALLLLGGLATLAAAARADAPDLGPRSAAMGGSGVAAGEPIAAAVLNPAAAASDRPAVGLGYRLAVPAADVQGRAAGAAAHGLLLAAVLPFPLGDLPAGVAFALHLPDRFVARAALADPGVPRLVRWEGWEDQVHADLVAAFRVAPGLFLGAGVSLLTALEASGRIDLDSPDGTTRARADITARAPVRAAARLGVRFEPLPSLALAFAFRDALALDADLRLDGRTDLGDPDLSGHVATAVQGTAAFRPRLVVAGIALRLDRFTLTADLAWRQWSALRFAGAEAAAEIVFGVPAPVVSRAVPTAPWRNTVSPSAGIEYAFVPAANHRIDVRGGYAWEPSPVPPQTGPTSLADPDRHLVTLGAAWTIGTAPDAADPPTELTLALALELHRLVPFSTSRDDPFDGPPLSAGGWVLGGRFGIEVRP